MNRQEDSHDSDICHRCDRPFHEHAEDPAHTDVCVWKEVQKDLDSERDPRFWQWLRTVPGLQPRIRNDGIRYWSRADSPDPDEWSVAIAGRDISDWFDKAREWLPALVDFYLHAQKGRQTRDEAVAWAKHFLAVEHPEEDEQEMREWRDFLSQFDAQEKQDVKP